jgi:hypothetical protein
LAKPTYAQLRQLLRDLGFDEEVGEHLVYRHTLTGTLVRLVLHEPGEGVLERDLVKVRTLLDLNALMDAAAFDQWVLKKQKQHEPAAG